MTAPSTPKNLNAENPDGEKAGAALAEAMDCLGNLRLSGTKLGLESPRCLAARLGNPQESLHFIHVAGTNGKGSVCAMLESIYRAAGYRTGLFTSPHLLDFRERIQVNRRPIPADSLLRLICQMQKAIANMNDGPSPTFFEAATILALLHFRQTQCDLVLWETGMGGRLDATNIVTPQLSILTNVALDHQQWLGNTIPEIAREKAGIIKPNIPSLSASTHPAAKQTIQNQANKMQSQHRHLTQKTIQQLTKGIPIALPGQHQRANAALAISATQILQTQFPISGQAQKQGLETVRWPGRIQTIQRDRQTIVLDGAHNETSIAALCAWLHKQWPNTPKAVLLGMLQDKKIQSCLKPLAAISNHFYLAPVKSTRSLPPSSLAAQLAQTSGNHAKTATFQTLKDALAAASKNQSPLLIICGSLYLVGEAFAILNHTPLNPAVQPADNPQENHQRLPKSTDYYFQHSNFF